MLKVILTNDDGIEALGLVTLYRALEGLVERYVVASEKPSSGVGHAVTTHKPIPVVALQQNWYAVGGTPADSARLALRNVVPGADWVISGINRGANLGVDVYTSGTVAAAREAALLGARSIALSQFLRPELEVDWVWTLHQCRRILPDLLDRPQTPGTFLNVNLPHLPSDAPDPQVVFCKLDYLRQDVNYQMEKDSSGRFALAHYCGNYHRRPQVPGRDVDVCFGGNIAITEIPLDITE